MQRTLRKWHGVRREEWGDPGGIMLGYGTHHVLDDKLDEHTGGVDLRFPHHNNEIAQCEAHNNTCGHDEKWCKHFVHLDICTFEEGRCPSC